MFKQPAKSFESVLTSSTTSAGSATDLGGHTWDHIGLEVPTFASGGTIYVQGSTASDGTFHRIHVIDPADGAPNVVQILQANGGHYHLPQLAPYQYLKVEVTTTITDSTTTFKFHVS